MSSYHQSSALPALLLNSEVLTIELRVYQQLRNTPHILAGAGLVTYVLARYVVLQVSQCNVISELRHDELQTSRLQSALKIWLAIINVICRIF